MRLTAVAQRLSELLGKTVVKTESCIGAEAKSKVDTMSYGLQTHIIQLGNYGVVHQ